jgi:imidazoleglycerol-phosphate dehydratase
MKEKKTASARPTTSAVSSAAALPRRAILHRKTRETDINLFLDVDGRGAAEISTGVGFFDHMLAALATHARFDLKVTCKGDLHIDAHHAIEDVGIVLGDALTQALGDKKGIMRFGHAYVPLDETLVRCVVDLSGRAYLHYDVGFGAPQVGSMPVDLLEDFFRAFCDHGRFNLHLDLLRGRSAHHIAEALFKGTARAIVMAATRDPRAVGVPSTKGAL